MSKTIVITGANRGLGLAMATLCKERGDTVYALCRSSSAELDALNINVISHIDIATDEGIVKAQSSLANIQIDLLINNAGILRQDTLQNFNKATITEQFSVNALAPLALSQALLSNLHAGSKIAFITSRMGSITDNTSGGHYGYRMSKTALNMGATSLANDLLSQEIAVGIYHPGYVQTDMVNIKGETTNGDISAHGSATQLLKLMDNLTLAESGVFKHAIGKILPW